MVHVLCLAIYFRKRRKRVNKKAQIVQAIDAIEPLLEDDSLDHEEWYDLNEIHETLCAIKETWGVE